MAKNNFKLNPLDLFSKNPFELNLNFSSFNSAGEFDNFATPVQDEFNAPYNSIYGRSTSIYATGSVQPSNGYWGNSDKGSYLWPAIANSPTNVNSADVSPEVFGMGSVESAPSVGPIILTTPNGVFSADAVPEVYGTGGVESGPSVGPIILTTPDGVFSADATPEVYGVGSVESGPSVGPIILTTPNGVFSADAAPEVYGVGSVESGPSVGPIILTTPGTIESAPSIPLEIGTNTSFVLTDTGGAGTGTSAGAAFQAAADMWSAILGDDVTVNLNIGFQTLGAGILGSTSSTDVVVSYAAVVAALGADATSAADATAVANLVGGSFISFETIDVNGNNIVDNNNSANNQFLSINKANAKALGITVDANGNPLSSAADGSITFSSSFTWDFDPTDGITSGAQDFVGVAFHEIGHALGFTSGVDLVDFYHGSGPGAPLNLDGFAIFNTLDLFRYSSTGTLNFRPGDNGYFSIDGGVTNLGGFSTGSSQGDGHQASHWKDGLGLGIMDPTAQPAGSNNYITNLDLLAFDAIGWDLNVTNVISNFPNGTTKTGTAANDFLIGSSVGETMNGANGNDILFGYGGSDILRGGPGADHLSGGAGDDYLYVDANDTLIDGGSGYDRLFAEAGSGALNINLATSHIEYAQGGGNNDTLNAATVTEAVKLYGNGGADTLTGSANADYINGGSGDDTMVGNAGADILDGSTGADSFDGGAGDDIFYIDADDTVIIGGADYDRVYVRGYSAGVNILVGSATGIEFANGNIGNDTFNGSASTTSVKLFGQGGNDTLRGGSAADQLYGGPGDDTLFGNGGDDILNGSTGADSLYGGAGNDILYIDENDLEINGGGDYDRVYANAGSGALNFNLTSGEVEYVSGSAFGDTFNAFGSSGPVKILGMNGNDILTGGNGADEIYGGNGQDTINGSAGDDFLSGGADADVFAFSVSGNPTWGHDTISDFEDGVDMLDMSNMGLNFAALTITQLGVNHTLVEYNGQSITLLGVLAADITESDFVF